MLVEAEIVVCGTLWVNLELPLDSEVIRRSIHCNRFSYPGPEVDNHIKDSKVMNAAFFCKTFLELVMKELQISYTILFVGCIAPGI